MTEVELKDSLKAIAYAANKIEKEWGNLCQYDLEALEAMLVTHTGRVRDCLGFD